MAVSKHEIIEFLAQEFPQALRKSTIAAITPKGAELLYQIDQDDLRPGQTVSGPTLMLVADFVLYVAIMGHLGLVAMAVTTNMTINFFRKPNGNKDIRAVCKLIKVGRTLVTGEVWLYSVGDEEPVAHVIGTYALPQHLFK
ncbi:PaaI family thioesterase [Acinetobacter sp. NIPH 2699]|uniref:PaaI family thioesterase n=1 Tax=Acinetobacter sp. NIPH 2699 TaxID=2923433 RepID=UPI001F4C49EA|nr:PaaI family thioesterase [Acinetobacter sp. NIPH 2699]MCH7337708.1 PaaI family thioesterase [Acinetobacter sp. NIPH 2699]